MSASRKGLKRHGLRGYIIEGPRGTFFIERYKRGRYLTRAEHTPPPFFNDEFKRLRDAAKEAKSWAGV